MRLPLAPAVFLFAGAIVLACAQADLTAPDENGLEPAALLAPGTFCPPDYTRIDRGVLVPLAEFDAVDLNGDGKICYMKINRPIILRKGIPAPTYVLIDNNLPSRKKSA
jgi:hypothetical protein